MPPAPAMQRKAVRGAVIPVLSVGPILTVLTMRTAAALPLLRLLVRLAAGDERWEPFDVFLVGRRVLRALLVVMRLCLRLLLVTRIEGLRLARRKRFAANRRLIVVALVIAVVSEIAALVAALLVVGLALAKLFLRRGDQPEIMLGVLIIVLGRDRVSGTLRIAGQLKIFFGDVGRSSANFYVRSVGLVHAR